MIHPLFVHFPIAMLVVYSLFELFRFEAAAKQPYWFYIKASLVISGTFLAYLTLATGDQAERFINETGTEFQKSLVNTHAIFAGSATAIFSLIAFSYSIEWLLKEPKASEFLNKRFLNIFLISSKIISKPYILITLALVGTTAITVAGALGAAMVYGPHIDIFVSFIYSFVSSFL
ncbi:hypothetical protein HY249_01890 [Candidatus Azambacteria bacterium]|nr:hypothetical protein [Candidatus Azambacteria bacterium]